MQKQSKLSPKTETYKKTKNIILGLTQGCEATQGAPIEHIFTVPDAWVWDLYHDKDKNLPVLYLAVWDASIEDADLIDLIGVNKNYFLFIREEQNKYE